MKRDYEKLVNKMIRYSMNTALKQKICGGIGSIRFQCIAKAFFLQLQDFA